MVRQIKLKRLTRVATVRQVDVYIHWSVFLMGALALLGGRATPIETIIEIAAYVFVLVIHEVGHLVMARRMGYDALSIEVYPFFGFAFFERPDSRVDRAAIAWGGVLAQAIIGVPLALYIALVGYTRFESLNAALVILGGVSLVMAALNLLPVNLLDGSTAWDIIPALIERRRKRLARRHLPYRSPR